MTELMIALHLRIYEALEGLQDARECGDDAGVVACTGEIEGLVEIAARHGVDLSPGYAELTDAA